MAKYRIVKLAGHNNAYKVRKRVLGFLWYYWRDDTGMFFSLKHCEDYIQKQLNGRGKDIVIREY